MAKISMVLGAGCALESLTWYGGRHSSYIFHSTGYKHSLMIMRQKHLLRSSTQCTRTNPSNLWHVQSKAYWGSSTLCLAPSCVLVSVKYSFTRCLSPYMPIKRLPKCTHPEQILKYTWVLLLGGGPVEATQAVEVIDAFEEIVNFAEWVHPSIRICESQLHKCSAVLNLWFIRPSCYFQYRCGVGERKAAKSRISIEDVRPVTRAAERSLLTEKKRRQNTVILPKEWNEEFNVRGFVDGLFELKNGKCCWTQHRWL